MMDLIPRTCRTLMKRPATGTWQALAVAALTAVAMVAQTAGLTHGDAQPRPDLTPRDVVRIQLESLRENDAADAGVAVAFRFASPANRAQTGPLPRFAKLFAAGPYALMLEWRDVDYVEEEVSSGKARQVVTLFGATDAVRFVFYLSRQGPGEYQDCWMTDAVTIEPVPGRSV